MLIQLKNGFTYDTGNFNLRRLFHRIPSAEINHTSFNVEGRSDIITDSKLNNRVITVEFLYESQDIFDYYLLRDELNALFMRSEAFYIIFKNEPYKRYLVRTNGQFEIPPNAHMQSFEVEFLLMNTYGESVFTTGDLISKTWDQGHFAWNDAINWDYAYFPDYFFTENNFTVINAGSAMVDPRVSYLKINVRFQGRRFGLRNLTTGDYYYYEDELIDRHEIELNGVRTLKDGTSRFRNTNGNLITLAPGENHFEFSMVNELESITFDFRYLYK